MTIIATTESPDIGCTDYDGLIADLEILELTPANLAEQLGISIRSVYQWKKTGVPQYAQSYLDRLMDIATLKRKLAP